MPSLWQAPARIPAKKEPKFWPSPDAILSPYLTTKLLETDSFPSFTNPIQLFVGSYNNSENAFWGPTACQAPDFPMVGIQFPEINVT